MRDSCQAPRDATRHSDAVVTQDRPARTHDAHLQAPQIRFNDPEHAHLRQPRHPYTHPHTFERTPQPRCRSTPMIINRSVAFMYSTTYVRWTAALMIINSTGEQ
ncbi:hypothetical protein C8Q79DRAFT_486005 [Trametes meyenii]|nr:hypothetical protein C8Q79DRAFT_486005 [Trametes meyenii]